MTHYNTTPVQPLDVVTGFNQLRGSAFISEEQKNEIYTQTRSVRSNSESSNESINGGRRARFVEATTFASPVAGPGEHRLPFAQPTKMSTQQESKPSDFGFGYIADNNPVEQVVTVPSNLHPNGQPLKSALKTPGQQTRFINPLSPTFKEEQVLEQEEAKTEKQQANDLKVKTRVRMAKMVLRGVNFSCSLIVLSMLSTSLTIFHATNNLKPRNGLPPWAKNTSTWPQLVVLVISCISLFFSVVIILAYCRGGHVRAQKLAVYYTMFAVGYFIFSTVMWLVGAFVLQGSKINGGGQDLWGWSCKDNKRRELFQDEVHYELICRLQNWSLICCIIEIVVELIAIAIYGVIFYRFHSKHKLRKSMDARDRARSDLYLAQLRVQSAPNTPGFAMTPRNPHFPSADERKADPYSTAEEGNGAVQFASVTPKSATTTSPFRLQAPPTKAPVATPKTPPQITVSSAGAEDEQPPEDRHNEHAHAAPGEQVYDSVPIPGHY